MPQTPPRPYQLFARLMLFVLLVSVLPLFLTASASAAKFIVTENQPQVVQYQHYTISPFYVPYSGYWGYRPFVYYPAPWFTGFTVSIGTGPIIAGVNQRWAYPWGGVWGSPWSYPSLIPPAPSWRPYYLLSSPWRSPYRPWGHWRAGQGFIAAGKPAWGRQPWRGNRGGISRDFVSGRPNLDHRPGLASQQEGRPVIISKPPPGQGMVPPRTASRPAGAAWGKPWQKGGPVVMDTHRPDRPSIRVIPPPPGSPRHLDASRRIPPPPIVDTNRPPQYYYPEYRGVQRARKFYRYGEIQPLIAPRFEGFVGRGRISAGQGGRSGFRGGGFRGGGFRGR